MAAQDKRPVAVLEPYTTGPVSDLNKKTVRGAMDSFLVNTGIYKLVDRARTEQVLKEQRIQRSQIGDPRTAKMLGLRLKADLICVTDLIKEGGYFNAQLSIVDVKTGEITNAAQKLIAKDDPSSVEKAIKEAMAELLGIKIDPPQDKRGKSGDGEMSASRITVMVQGVPNYSLVDGLEKGIRGTRGVDNVSVIDYQGSLATFEVRTKLSTQDLAGGIGQIGLNHNYRTWTFRVYEATGNIIRVQCQ
jgi:hypothetical protein